MKYSSAITFLYYKDFSYGVDFLEDVLELNQGIRVKIKKIDYLIIYYLQLTQQL